MMNDVQTIPCVLQAGQDLAFKPNKVFEKLVMPQNKPDFTEDDVFQSSSKSEQTTQAPEIKTGRILIGRLTKEQIEAINESGELPQNAKFQEYNGQLRITWNALDVTTGTHKLPAGYEVKNDIFGFTHVVREGTKNIFIK